MAKKRLPKDSFDTFAGISDDKAKPLIPDRDLGAELHKKSYQQQQIDNFERQMGIAPPKPKPNLTYKSRVFSPDYEKDNTLLTELMNNPKYTIIKWQDTWTVEGLFKVFCVYAENNDYKTPEEKLKEIAEGK